MNSTEEVKFLDGLFDDYITSNDSPYLRNMRELEVERIKDHLRPNGIALELGCEIGYMTSLLAPLVDTLHVVEGSPRFAATTKSRQIPNVEVFCSLFEYYEPSVKYDYIFMSHVLEHLAEPIETLQKAKTWLKPGGMIFIIVPNGNAASRRLAEGMGIIKDRFALTPNDIRGGHRRVYDIPSLVSTIAMSGLTAVTWSGLFFKPFADFQLDQLIESGFLTKEHLRGLDEVGKIYPDLCGAIMVTAK